MATTIEPLSRQEDSTFLQAYTQVPETEYDRMFLIKEITLKKKPVTDRMKSGLG